jgi:hypothetical protein
MHASVGSGFLAWAADLVRDLGAMCTPNNILLGSTLAFSWLALVTCTGSDLCAWQTHHAKEHRSLTVAAS